MLSSPSGARSSSSSSAYPVMAARGVRSSWETVATNSSFARAAARSGVVSRSEKIRPISTPPAPRTDAVRPTNERPLSARVNSPTCSPSGSTATASSSCR